MRQRKASLGLERLDTRDVPACVVSHGVQNTMEIIGDGAPDTVIINDNGTGLITGSATGWGTFVFSGIDTIKVNTWAGDDAVIYNLTASLQPGQLRLVVARLGAGNDSFIANLFNQGSGVGSDVLANASLVISGHGGEGNDILRVNAQHDVDVAIGSALAILMGGDSGQDQIIAEYRGENAGSVAFNQLDGGTGNDSILGSLREDVGSTGISSASVQGDDGDDALGLYMWTEHPPLQALLDGGAGVDTAGHTANVTVVNVP